jgi:hypothetical protein
MKDKEVERERARKREEETRREIVGGRALSEEGGRDKAVLALEDELCIYEGGREGGALCS